MPSETPVLKIPSPLGSDALGILHDTTAKAVARIEELLATVPLVVRGLRNFDPAVGQTQVIQVNWGYEFPGVPTVVAGTLNGNLAGHRTGAYDVTTTGCKLACYREAGSSNIPVTFIAIYS